MLAIGVGLLVALYLFIIPSFDDTGMLKPMKGEDPGQAQKTGIDTGDAAVIDQGESPEKEIVKPGATELPEGDAKRAAAVVGTIKGRIISEFGDPMPGAEVLAWNSAEDRSRAGPDGRFHLDVTQDVPRIEIHVYRPGFVPILFEMEISAKGISDLGDLVLELGGSVSGYVSNLAGKALDGAEVLAQPVQGHKADAPYIFIKFRKDHPFWKSRVGPDGYYRITDLPEGPVRVAATHPDHIPQVIEDFSVIKGRDRSGVNLVLEGAKVISGRIQDENKKPVEGAEITTDDSIDFGSLTGAAFMPGLTRRPTARTDAQGRFALQGLGNDDYDLLIKCPPLLPRSMEDVPSGTMDLLITIFGGTSLAGRVKDAESGEGIDKFEVKPEQEEISSSAFKILKGEEAGAFRIEGMARDAYRLSFTADGYAEKKIVGSLADSKDGEVIEVVLGREAVVSGIVLSPSGDPASKGEVRIEEIDEEDFHRLAENVLVGKTAAELMEKPGMVEYDANPVGNIPFHYYEFEWKTVVKSEADGRFIVRGIPEGKYRLTASHSDHADSRPIPLALEFGEVVKDLEVRLNESGAIMGYVFDTMGDPKQGARVEAGLSNGRGSRKKASTDQEGRYEIKGLTPGEYSVGFVEETGKGDMNSMTLSLFSEGRQESIAQKALVRAGEATRVDFQERVKASMMGRVTEEKRPLQGLSLQIIKGGGFFSMPFAKSVTDENGCYAFPELLPGKYRVHLILPGHDKPWKAEATLGEGELAERNFDLPSGRIAGRVTDETSGLPVPGADVSLERILDEGEKKDDDHSSDISVASSIICIVGNKEDEEEIEYLATSNEGTAPVKTDMEGYYEIRFLEEGKYKVAAEKPNYKKGEFGPVEVLQGHKNERCDIRLARD